MAKGKPGQEPEFLQSRTCLYFREGAAWTVQEAPVILRTAQAQDALVLGESGIPS